MLEEQTRNTDRSWDDADYKGIPSDYVGLSYQIGDENIAIGDITDEDYEAVNELIYNAKPAEKSIYADSKFYEIANEEIDRFFHGECTAEECAEHMQDRISTYLSEQYS